MSADAAVGSSASFATSLAVAGCSAAACCPLPAGFTLSSHSSSTQANSSSMASLATSAVKTSCQRRWQQRGSSSARPGTLELSARASSSPSLPSSRKMRTGSLPRLSISGPGAKSISHTPDCSAVSAAGVSAVVSDDAEALPSAVWASNSSRPDWTSCTFSSSLATPSWAASTMPRSTSTDASSRSTASRSMARRPSRISSSRVSMTWVKAEISGKPKVPAPPLMEWAALKMALISSISVDWSRFSKPDSRTSSPSRHSSKKTSCTSDKSIYQSKTRLTVAIRRSGSKGLTIQPLAPAALPSIFFSVLLSVVSTRMGL